MLQCIRFVKDVKQFEVVVDHKVALDFLNLHIKT